MKYILSAPPLLLSLALSGCAASADTLFEANFEAQISGDKPDATLFELKGVNSKAKHRVAVTDENASPFDAGKHSLVIEDPDASVTPRGPEVWARLPKLSKGPVTVRFDYLIPQGQGENSPALLLPNGGSNSFARVGLNNNGQIVSRYGGKALPFAFDTWTRVELTLSKIDPGAGGEKLDIAITPWDKATGKSGATRKESGWNFNKEGDIAVYDALRFAFMAVGKDKPDSTGKIYLDNLLVTGEPSGDAPAVVAAAQPQGGGGKPKAQPVVLDDNAPSGPIVDSDFSRLTDKVNVVRETGTNIVGALPQGWDERSGFQDGIKINYSRVEVDGRPAMRAERTAGNEIQMRYDLKGFKAGALYRLEMTARNPAQMDLKVGIRDNSGPFKFHWVTSPSFGDEWQTLSQDFTLNSVGNSVGLYIIAKGPVGALDIARVRLMARSKADILADIKKKYPDGGPRNLIAQTRFPLGLQSGWAVENDFSLGDQVRIESDPQETSGPSGFPALKMSLGDRALDVFTPPFDVAEVLEPHVVSLYIKGRGDGTLAVLRDGGTIGSTNFKFNSKEWQRLEVPFDPGIGGKNWALRFHADGVLWIDALQVEPGEKATAYAPQKAVEVALSPGKGDAELVRIHFDDEPAVVRYAVTGEAGGAVLKAKVVDAFGREANLPPVKLGAGKLQGGELKYNLLPQSLFGPLRIEAHVEDAAGTRISSFNELVMTRLHRPRYWGKDAPNSMFGTHIHPTQQGITLAKAIGTNWVRLHDAGATLMRWFTLEPQPGKWEFGDKGIEAYRKANLKILGVLQTTPKWAAVAQAPPKAGTYYAGYYLPKDINDWKNYCRTVAERYKGVIDSYDIWNEPWGGGYLNIGFDASRSGKSQFIKPDKDRQIAEYTKLLRAAHEAVKGVDPSLKVLLEVSNGSWNEVTLANGALKVSDGGGYHTYPGGLMGVPESPESGRARFQVGQVQRFGATPVYPIWMTEGAPTADTAFSGIYRHTVAPREGEDVVKVADKVARFLLSTLGNGVERTFLYSQGNYRHFGETAQRFSANVLEDGYPHPSAAAHSTFAWLMEDTKPGQILELAPGVSAYLFEGQGRSVAAIVTGVNPAPYTLPKIAGTQTLDLFGNALTGEVKAGANVLYISSNGPVATLQKALGGKVWAPK